MVEVAGMAIGMAAQEFPVICQLDARGKAWPLVASLLSSSRLGEAMHPVVYESLPEQFPELELNRAN